MLLTRIIRIVFGTLAGLMLLSAVADILLRGAVHDPALQGVVVTVPEVRMTPDLKTATVFVIPLGGKGADTIVQAFARNAKFLRGEIAHRVNLRHAPELRFRLDTSFEESRKIDTLLGSPEVKRDTGPEQDREP